MTTERTEIQKIIKTIKDFIQNDLNEKVKCLEIIDLTNTSTWAAIKFCINNENTIRYIELKKTWLEGYTVIKYNPGKKYRKSMELSDAVDCVINAIEKCKSDELKINDFEEIIRLLEKIPNTEIRISSGSPLTDLYMKELQK